MINKKGNINIILFIGLFLFLLLFVGMGLVIGASVIDWVFDETVPELKDIGMVGGANVTQAIEIAVTPVDTFVQNLTWITGVVYLFGMMGIFGFAFVFRGAGDKWLIGFYIGLVLILVISCIFISNIYEDFHNDEGDLGERLRSHVILSFLLLYCPAVMSLISFIAGIILFGGDSEGGI